MSPKRYEELKLAFENETGEIVPIPRLLNDAREAAATGDATLAYDLIMSCVAQIEDTGFFDVAYELLDELIDIMPEIEMSPEQRTWFLNAKGLAMLRLGKIEDAKRLFLKMLQEGQKLDSSKIMSTAQQNLAIQALDTEDYEQAIHYSIQSLQSKSDAGDYYGWVQVALNVASLEIQRSNPDGAQEIADIIQKALREVRPPHLLLTLSGIQGNIAAKRRQYKKAEIYFRKARRYAQQIQDFEAELLSIANIAATRSDLGDARNAIRWYQRAIKLAKDLNSPTHLLLVHQGLAVTLAHVKRNKEALVHFRAAQQLATQVGDRRKWAQLTVDVGALVTQLEDPNQAISILTSSLNVLQESGDKEWQLNTLRNLALAGVKAEDPKAVDSYVEQALQLLDPEAGRDRVQLLTLPAQAWLSHGPSKKIAVERFNKGLEILKDTVSYAQDEEYQHEVAWFCVQAGNALSHAKRGKDAIRFFTQALEIYERIGDTQALFRTRNDRANTLARLRRFVEADNDHTSNLELAKQLDDRAMALLATMNLAESARRQENVQEALRLGDAALELAQALDDREAEAEVQANKATALVDISRYEDAEEVFHIALEIGRSAHGREFEARIMGGLGNIEFLRGNYEEAASYYRRAAKISRSIGDIEDLLQNTGAVLEAFSALGDERKTQKTMHRLVEIADREKTHQPAFKSFPRAGRWWLRKGNIRNAVNLYAAAIALATHDLPIGRPYEVIDQDDDTDLIEDRSEGLEANIDEQSTEIRWLFEVSKAWMAVVVSIEVEKYEEPRKIYELILDKLVRGDTKGRKILTNLLEQVLEVRGG